MNTQATFEKRLKRSGFSLTQPRQAVFDALQHHQSLTLREIYAKAGGHNRSTIYRTIALFEQLGIVVRIPQGWKHRYELGEAFHEHHHHATCTACGASIALPEDTVLEERLLALAKRRGFNLVSHQIELYGLCQLCGSTPASDNHLSEDIANPYSDKSYSL